MLRSPRRRARLLGAAVLISLATGPFLAMPASAAVDVAGCTRTFDGAVDSASRINQYLEEWADWAEPPVYCFTGQFTLNEPLDVRATVTLKGVGDATFVVSGPSAVTTTAATADLTVTIDNLRITAAPGRAVTGSLVDGRAESDGVPIASVSVVLRDSQFAGGGAEVGGAVRGDVVIVDTSEFTDNSATRGGAVYATGVATISRTTFESNDATEYGGALYAVGAVDIENSTFVRNAALLEGGAVYSRGGRVVLSTFLDNTSADLQFGADVPGESIYLDGTGLSDLAIRGNIFAGSSGRPQLGIGEAILRVIVDRGGNVFGTAREVEVDVVSAAESSRFGVSTLSLFGATPALAANGGDTRTVALIAGSPAIDVAGDESLGGPNVDQRGLPREGLRDAGAFEVQPAVVDPPAPDAGAGPTETELAATGFDSLAILAPGAGVAMLLAMVGGLLHRRQFR